MGERKGWKEKDGLVGSSGIQSPLPVLCCTREGRQASLEGPVGCFCFVTPCVGGGRGGLASLAIKSFLCHKDPSQWPGCGAAGRMNDGYCSGGDLSRQECGSRGL